MEEFAGWCRKRKKKDIHENKYKILVAKFRIFYYNDYTIEYG